MSVKSLICVSIAFVMSVVIGIYGGNMILENMRNNGMPVIKDDLLEDDLSKILAPEGGKSPTDFDAIYNFNYAKKKMLEANNVMSNITGNVTSMKMENQVVNTIKQFDGKNVFFQSTSEGKFAKVYSRVFYDGSVIYRTGDYSGGKWGTYGIVEEKDYVERFGYMPRNFIPYVVNKDTVKSGEQAVKTDAGYSFKLVLNDIATTNYKRYLLDNSGSLIMPEFSKVELTVIIDGDWNLVSIFYDEIYKVKKSIPVLGTLEADCESKLTEIFTYGNAVIENNVKP